MRGCDAIKSLANLQNLMLQFNNIHAVFVYLRIVMKRLTATILTFNEEARIEACLQSLAGVADEIVVVDSFSTDSTVEICQRYGCRIRQRRLAGYGAQRQFATSLATHPYVLSIDADEVLSPALAGEICRLKEEGFTHRVYTAPRLNFYCGRPVRHCGWYPDRQLRLFDRRFANWSLSEVEEKVVFRDSVNPEPLAGDILHYRCTTPDDFRQKERGHALLSARQLVSGEKIRVLTPVLEAAKSFLNCYLRQGGIGAGAAGLAISRERMACSLISHSKARKLQKQSNIENKI